MEYPSWGFYPKVQNQTPLLLSTFKLPIAQDTQKNFLPRGLGRSYGDSCLNENGYLLLTQQLNHFIAFDSQSGVLTCESGVSFDEILKVFVPKGWFLPVTPGTKFVTVGGAIANDVHGKNHHVAGSFGHHVLEFELIRSNGDVLRCSPVQNPDMFKATIGGLGLTGLISWASFKLIPIKTAFIQQEQITFNSLSEFLRISSESDKQFAYTVAWVDCVNSGQDIRGIFIRGNHSENQKPSLSSHDSPQLTVPMMMPDILLNSITMKIFNELYYRKNFFKHKKGTTHYNPFFYPLDSISGWNHIYGQRGFLQYQFTVPNTANGIEGLEKIFSQIKKSGWGSFLAVLKTFGSMESLGLLSYPKEGITLALDFPNVGEPLLQLLNSCDAIVSSLGGNVYPAKDSRMSHEHFYQFYPAIEKFKKYIDPQFSSSFWRRIL